MEKRVRDFKVWIRNHKKELITAQVVKNADGTQTVKLLVPDAQLPAYSPYLNKPPQSDQAGRDRHDKVCANTDMLCHQFPVRHPTTPSTIPHEIPNPKYASEAHRFSNDWLPISLTHFSFDYSSNLLLAFT